jgi:hypothetical protein
MSTRHSPDLAILNPVVQLCAWQLFGVFVIEKALQGPVFRNAPDTMDGREHFAGDAYRVVGDRRLNLRDGSVEERHGDGWRLVAVTNDERRAVGWTG